MSYVCVWTNPYCVLCIQWHLMINEFCNTHAMKMAVSKSRLSHYGAGKPPPHSVQYPHTQPTHRDKFRPHRVTKQWQQPPPPTLQLSSKSIDLSVRCFCVCACVCVRRIVLVSCVLAHCYTHIYNTQIHAQKKERLRNCAQTEHTHARWKPYTVVSQIVTTKRVDILEMDNYHRKLW